MICEDQQLKDFLQRLQDSLRVKNLTVGVAESCTGGLCGAYLTILPGSSDVFLGGVISYSNAVKSKLLGVDPQTLAEHGAVSKPVAAAMAEGIRSRIGCDYGLSFTGVAGPGGGSEKKPVGLVWTAISHSEGTSTAQLQLDGSRDEIRHRAVTTVLENLLQRLDP